MTQPAWHFRCFAPGDNLSDPDFTKALFASDSEAAIARSLVREALQNSLDARADDTVMVRVRIAIHRNGEAASATEVAPFTAGLGLHLASKDNGLTGAPALDAPIPFLVLEDFGTKGLRGDPEHWQPVNIGQNAFFLFFRALGRSGKADEARGRWGVGKFVFPMSGRAHAIWGLTVRNDSPGTLLMGRAVLRTHGAEGAQWHPDGHWGERRTGGSNLVTPSIDPAIIERFRATFKVTRTDEPGLSVVVPWVIDEITADGIRDAVLGEYFLPLLRGELEVELVAGDHRELLDGAAVRAYADRAENRTLKERLALAVSVADGAGVPFEWPAVLEWDDLSIRHEALPTTLRDKLGAALDEGRPLSIVLQVTVGRKDAPGRHLGKLHVNLMRADGLGPSRPLLIRDGISISEEKTKPLYDHVAILIAEHCSLATAIGDAETPAHEHLQHELLKDRYKYPRKLVTFVRESAAALLRAIRHGDSEDDPFALAGFFPIEADTGPAKPISKMKPKGENQSGEPPELPRPLPRSFRVSQVIGGFTVTGNAEPGEAPEDLIVQVAYDVRRGNPFKRYRTFDFDVAKDTVRKEAVGCDLASMGANRIVIRPTQPDFKLSLTGFDSSRDLVVRVSPAEGES